MKNKLATKDLCMIALWTAIISIMAQISIPMPLGVPMTMQTFAITMAAIILGSKRGCMASGIYVLLGIIGIPVFANFKGGVHTLLSPTGGFILSFPLMAWLIGLGAEYKSKIKGSFTACLVLGNATNYILGTIVFCLITNSPIKTGILGCVLPFIPTTILQATVASLLALKSRRLLLKLTKNRCY